MYSNGFSSFSAVTVAVVSVASDINSNCLLFLVLSDAAVASMLPHTHSPHRYVLGLPSPFLVRLLLPPAHPQTCTPAASASSFCLLLPSRTSRHVLQLRLLLLFVRPLLFSRNPQIQAAHSPPLKVNVAAASLQHPVLVFETHGIEANPTSALAKRPGNYLEHHSSMVREPRPSGPPANSQQACPPQYSVTTAPKTCEHLKA